MRGQPEGGLLSLWLPSSAGDAGWAIGGGFLPALDGGAASPIWWELAAADAEPTVPSLPAAYRVLAATPALDRFFVLDSAAPEGEARLWMGVPRQAWDAWEEVAGVPAEALPIGVAVATPEGALYWSVSEPHVGMWLWRLRDGESKRWASGASAGASATRRSMILLYACDTRRVDVIDRDGTPLRTLLDMQAVSKPVACGEARRDAVCATIVERYCSDRDLQASCGDHEPQLAGAQTPVDANGGQAAEPAGAGAAVNDGGPPAHRPRRRAEAARAQAAAAQAVVAQAVAWCPRWVGSSLSARAERATPAPERRRRELAWIACDPS